MEDQKTTQGQPQVGSDALFAEKLARALALQYYQGLYRERYKAERGHLKIDGTLTDGAKNARRESEREATNMADMFWHEWTGDAEEFLSANDKDHSPIGAVGASKPESNSVAPIG